MSLTETPDRYIQGLHGAGIYTAIYIVCDEIASATVTDADVAAAAAIAECYCMGTVGCRFGQQTPLYKTSLWTFYLFC